MAAEIQPPPRSERHLLRRGRRRGNLLAEFWHLTRTTGKWWLAPILVAIAILGFLVVLGGTPLAPFIYSLF